jgi:hypothetical protein
MADTLTASKTAVREALIQCLVNASGAMKEAYWFTIRGRYNVMSMSTLMFLSPEDTMRQAYHGGDLAGGHIGILMERAEDIINEVEAYIIDSKKNLVNDTTNQVPASDEDIQSTCESIKHLLVLWNMVFSLVHTEYPSDEDCDRTQDFIDTAISIGDKLGMSRTIKIHGCMSHIVSQMRQIPCGLSDFDKNYMEQYHQEGGRI